MVLTSQQIVDRWGVELKGQQVLFPDPDLVLRNTEFRSVDQEFDRAALIHWWMNVYVPDGRGDFKTPFEVYKTWSDAMYGRFRYVNVGGYRPETNQSSIEIACIKEDPLDLQVTELAMWLPHLKGFPIKRYEDLGPGKIISIFENTLSEYGSYSLFLWDDPAPKCIIGKMAWHCPSEVAEFQTVSDAVNYIRENLWYKETADGL